MSKSVLVPVLVKPLLDSLESLRSDSQDDVVSLPLTSHLLNDNPGSHRLQIRVIENNRSSVLQSSN